MQTTENYGLNKPDLNDFYDVQHQNNNMDIIDAELNALTEGTKQVGNAKTVNSFSVYTSPAQLSIDSWHIPTIVRAMPENSMFIAANSSGFNSVAANNQLPVSEGAIEIIRPRADIGRTRVIYSSGANATKGHVYICDLDETNWTIKGWKHIGDGGNAKSLNGYDNTAFFKAVGGTITGKTTFRSGYATQISIDRAVDGAIPWVSFLANEVLNGQVGLDSNGNLVLLKSSSSNQKTVLDTGNKPSGTYIGNGESSERHIATGGIGSALLVYTDSSASIILPNGGIVIYGDNTTPSIMIKKVTHFVNGDYYINGNVPYINASGVTYKWEVL